MACKLGRNAHGAYLVVIVLAAAALLQAYEGMAAAAPATQAAAAADTKIAEDKPADENAAAAASSAGSAAATELDGKPFPEGDELIEWIRAHGGQVSVTVRQSPERGRFVVAPRAFKQGELLMSVPMSICYRADDELSSGLQVAAAYLLAELHDPASPYSPYLRALPDRAGVRSFYDIPEQYFPLLQSNATVTAIREHQGRLAELWSSKGPAIQETLGKQLGLTDMYYSVALLLTRLFQFTEGLLLVPLLDLANHHNGCTTVHKNEPCKPGAAELCVKAWTQEDVPAGAEICNSYKTYMLQDRALLQYGFLQADAAAGELSGMDRHDFDPAQPWEDLASSGNLSPPRFEGSAAEVAAEVVRLQRLLQEQQDFDAQAAKVKPDLRTDPDGALLQQVLVWRQQRQAAIRAELGRLGRLQQRLDAWQQLAAAQRSNGGSSVDSGSSDSGSSGSGGSSGSEVYGHLIAWLKQHGALVNVAVAPPAALPPSHNPSSSSSSDSKSCDAQGSCAAAPLAPPQPSAAANAAAAATARVVAAVPVQAGDLLAAIPAELAYAVRPGTQRLVTAVELMLDRYLLVTNSTTNTTTASNSGSSDTAAAAGASDTLAAANSSRAEQFAPLLSSLPAFGSGLPGLFSFPKDLLHLLHNKAAADHVIGVQSALHQVWTGHAAVVESTDNSMTFAELAHAMDLLSAHLMSFEGLGQAVVPLLSLAPHTNTCPHEEYLAPCPQQSNNNNNKKSNKKKKKGSSKQERQCIYWRAGSDLAAGDNVCTSYGFMMPDRALLEYSIPLEQQAEQWRQQPQLQQQLQQQPPEVPEADGLTLQILAMDRHDVSADSPLSLVGPAAGLAAATRQAPIFAGDRQQCVTEVGRLALLHDALSSTETAQEFADASAALSGSSSSSSGGDSGSSGSDSPAATAAAAGAAGGGITPRSLLLSQLYQLHHFRTASVGFEAKRLMDGYNISTEEVADAMRQLLASEEEAAAAEAAAAAAAGGSSGEMAAIQKMITWVKGFPGAEVYVDVAEVPGAGRGVVASRHIQKGQLLAAIPVDACFTNDLHGGNGSHELSAANLYAAMADSGHSLQTYFATLPTRDQVLCPLVALPPEYLFLLQSDILEANIIEYQQRVKEFWVEHEADITRSIPGMLFEDYAYTRSMLSTRLFGHKVRGSLMVPVMDMSNHRQGCTNTYRPGPCPSDPDRECFLWHAGHYLGPGAEVCNSYKFMLNDKSFFQYGFLQGEPTASALQGIDRRDFNRTAFWALHEGGHFGPPDYMPLSLMKADEELIRLNITLYRLEALDHLAAQLSPAHSDPGGQLLSMLLEWRQQRKAGVMQEIKRIKVLADTMDAAAATAAAAANATGGNATEAAAAAVAATLDAAAGGAVANVTEQLVGWLTANGAKVAPLMVGPSRLSSAADAGRGVFASAAIPAGSSLAVIPLGLALPVVTTNMLSDLHFLWRSITHPKSSHRPYWDSLAAAGPGILAAAATAAPAGSTAAGQRSGTSAPAPANSRGSDNTTVFKQVTRNFSTVSLYTLPEEYVSLLQHKPTEEFVRNTRTAIVDNFISENTEVMEELAMTPADLLNMLSVVATRVVQFETEGPHLIPLVDMANHRPGCPHRLGVRPCSRLLSQEEAAAAAAAGVGAASPFCVLWEAGEDLAEGDEVCSSYGRLLPDKALLQYGFLLNSSSQAGPGPLYGMDRAGLDNDTLPWHFVPPVPDEFTGTPEQVKAERDRLVQLLKQLKSGDSAAAKLQPAASDAGGRLLELMRRWRLQRQAVVAAEADRLSQQLLALAADATARPRIEKKGA